MPSNATCNEILARFPGPVTLYPSRSKWLLILAACLLFVAGAWVPGARNWGDWFGVVFFGVGVVVSVLMMSHHAAALTLDGDGLEMLNLFRRTRWQWRDTSGFEVESLPFPPWRKYVAFDNAKMQSPTLARVGHALFIKHNAMLGESYGLAVADLTQLIARWRERALGTSALTADGTTRMHGPC